MAHVTAHAVFAMALEWPINRAKEIWGIILKNHLWRRMIKIVVATTVTNAIMLIPSVEAAVGKAGYLAGITTAFGHPGRRFGQMAEALVLTAAGTLLATAWSLLGLYLGSLVIYSNPPAASGIRALFLVVSFLLHGYFRSFTPRVFLGTVLFIIVSVVNLVSPTKVVTAQSATLIIYPIFIAIGILLLVNLLIYPEFSSSYLGKTVIDTLQEVSATLRQSGNYFTQLGDLEQNPSPNQESKEPSNNQEQIEISVVSASKAAMRAKLVGCKAAQSECNFELAFSILPPRDLKSLSQVSMTKLVMNTVAIIGACESKFALLGDDDEMAKHVSKDSSALADSNSSANDGSDEVNKDAYQDGIKTEKLEPFRFDEELKLVKPSREIESGDPELLRHFIHQIKSPYLDLQKIVDRSIEMIKASVAYSYHVPEMAPGIKTPAGLQIAEIDVCTESIIEAIQAFDRDIQSSLNSTGVWEKIRDDWPDLMPREEIFLVSSFYLNLRQAAVHVSEMLEQSRFLVDKCQNRKRKRRLYAPRISWRKWLHSGGGEDQATEAATASGKLQTGMRDVSHDDDDDDDDDGAFDSSGETSESKDVPLGVQDPELGPQHPSNPKPAVTGSKGIPKPTASEDMSTATAVAEIRVKIADLVEWLQRSDHVQYALKVCIASFLTLWPAFVPAWTSWYSINRGLWAALQLVMITEPTVGSAIQTFILRAAGTTFGCLWGWAAYEADRGNRYVCGVMLAIGVVPASYVILGTKYVKAGVVTIVSITVVALATELETMPGSAAENFLKRFIAFNIGAAVALIVQFAFVPVKARTRMVEALARCLRHISEMENCMAFGIESPKSPDLRESPIVRGFARASGKAKASLRAAEGLMPFCAKEPRLKGSLEGPLLVYNEMVFVLHQIIDRMENMLTLRTIYGSGPLEEYHDKISPYRRNLSASVVISLFAVHAALSTGLPLPQFLPSARLAQLRMINRVREVVQQDERRRSDADDSSFTTRKHAVRQNFLSWNAESMARAEIVEYLEELCELAKLLVGANEFRSGLLSRPTFREHVKKIGQEEDDEGLGITAPAPVEKITMNGPRRRRATTGRSSKGSEEAELPYTLKRIQTKKFDAVLKKQRTWEKQM